MPDARAPVARRPALKRLGLWLAGESAAPAQPMRQAVEPSLEPATAARPRQAQRMYAAARNTRTTIGFGGASTSADAELNSSLTAMRNRSRQMVRDSAYARRAREIVVNNVIGSGVGMQAQVMNERGNLRTSVNDAIEIAFAEWCAADSCHTGGKLHFHDLERAAMAQVFEAGEVLLRVWPQRFGRSAVPLAIELIEAERIATEVVQPGPAVADNEIRMGVEVDRFGRPQAVWLRRLHAGDIRGAGVADELERVPADQLFHLHIVTRWPQTRGEPWLHAVLRKLDDANEYTQLELTAARGSAAYFATLETDPDAQPPEQGSDLADEEDEAGRQVMNIEPLMVQELGWGQHLKFHAPNRPNTALDPFMRYMLREVATGAGCSYASLSGDYSQSNYSSSRLALLDDRDGWRALQQWWLRAFRLPLHKLWLRQAVMAGAVDIPLEQYGTRMAKFEAVRFKPRGWSWVDPAKEQKAFKEAVRSGMTTLTDVIASTGEGRDIEDMIAARRRELDLLAAAGITTDTDPGAVQPTGAAAVLPGGRAADADELDDEDDEETVIQTARRVLQFRGAA